MSEPSELFLYQELMLLSLRDREGTVAMGAWYHQAVAGAILAELLLAGRIRAGPGKDAPVELLDPSPLGDPLIDECLAAVRGAKKPLPLTKWFTRFSNVHELRDRAALGLVRQGILRADEDKVLLLFKRRIYPEVDHAPEAALVERLRQAVFEDAAELDPRTIVLVALAHRTGLLAVTFGAKRLKPRKEHLERIARSELVGDAAEEVVAAVRTAVIAAAVVPSITT